MLIQRWRIEMLGGMRVHRGSLHVSRFQSQKVASLLAYLAFYPARPHLRDELLNLLWPEDDIDAARNRLRVGLTSLRRQMEPPGTLRGTVLIADRISLNLNSEAFTTDTAQFENALAAALRAIGEEQIHHLNCAVDFYGGELLPGFSEMWVVTERERLAHSYSQALHRLTRCLVQAHDLEGALVYARRAVQNDPLHEEAHRDVMRLYLALGQPSAAQRQYEEAKRVMRDELSANPSHSTQKLARQIEDSVGRSFSPNVRLGSAGARNGEVVRDSEDSGRFGPGDYTRHQGSLPLFLTRFFGRGEEHKALCALLSEQAADNLGQNAAERLVTLTGPGGIGKTRLAVAIAESMRPAFADNVWFVPLADVADSRLVYHAIATALNVPGVATLEPRQQVVEALMGKPALLLLDNCEHLVEGMTPLVFELFKHLPGLTCLLTSRRTLGADGEREFLVSPLPIPTIEGGDRALPLDILGVDSTPRADAIEILSFPAVQLFVDRAQAVQPDFQVTARNASDIAGLCRALEGIPLAIELAASRARVVTPAQMRIHLSNRFDLLVNRRADKDMRHRSLRAALEWSFYLLTPELRRLFARLSVFAGGWNLRSAWAVCENAACEVSAPIHRNSQGLPEPFAIERDLDLLERIEQLRVNSLILAEESDGEVRFRMLETLREFACEQLNAEDQAEIESRYVRYFVSLAEQSARQAKGANLSLEFRRLYIERDNIRAAFDICLRRGADESDALLMTRALKRFWTVRGLVSEGRERAAAALAHSHSQDPTTLRVDVLIHAGTLAADQDDFTSARELYKQALTIATKLDYELGVGRATDCLGVISMRHGDYETANALFERAMKIHREIENSEGMAAAFNHLAVTAQLRERYDDSKSLYERGLSLHTELGDRLAIAQTFGNLGMIADAEGDYPKARSLYEQSLAIHRELENLAGIASVVGNLAIIAAKNRDFEQARIRFDEVHAVFRKLHMVRAIAILKGNLGSLEMLQGNTKAACGYYQESLDIHRQLNNRSGMIHALATMGPARAAVGEAERAAACLSECMRMCLDTGQNRTLADVLEEFAALKHCLKQPEQSAWFYGAADALRERIGVAISPERSEKHDDVRTSLKSLLDETSFAAADANGRAAPIEDVVRAAD